MSKKIIVLSLFFVFLMTAGFGCKTTNKTTQEAAKAITLTYWRVFDGEDDFSDSIAAYKALHPYINIEYRKLRYEEYESELLNALAEDRGPDIFSVHNTWMKKYQSKLAPLPETTSMVYPVVQGTIKKEVVNQLQTTPSLTVNGLKDTFADVVSSDVVLNDGKIYGLPLSVDTLAMYYNRDLFNNAGIVQPAIYWNKEFLQAVNKLTRQDTKKGILQSGVALGGGSNVNRASDILAALMIQNGATMINDGGTVTFNTIPSFGRETGYNPGLEALRFYTDFANPTKESYSWNAELKNSLDMFISGNLAIMFSYSYDFATIKAQAPKLNFSVAKFPQIEGNPPTNINFANYWIEVVSKKSTHQNEAWDFLQFITKEEQVKGYLEKTKKPAALKKLIPGQLNDDEIGVFASQVLTAKSWYHGKNPQAAEDAISELIDNTVKNVDGKLQEIINGAAAKVQQTID
jgi:multiple sugar transport system substrate-binding protein